MNFSHGRSQELLMRVMNWMQTRLHGTKKPEHTAVSSRRAHTSGDLRRNDDDLDGWAAAMLSIGTFGVTEGGGVKSRHGSDTPWTTAANADELDRLQEELRLLVRAKGAVTRAEDDDEGRRHRTSLSRTSSSTNGREVAAKLNQRSIRKIMASALGDLLHRPSCRETMPEASVSEFIWPLLHKNTPPEKPALPEPVMKCDPTFQTPQKEQQEGSKWIRTDSECKFHVHLTESDSRL